MCISVILRLKFCTHQVRKLHVTVSMATIIQSPFAFVVIFSNLFDIIVMWVPLYLKKWCNCTFHYLYTQRTALQSLLAQNSQRCPTCLCQFIFCMCWYTAGCQVGAIGDTWLQVKCKKFKIFQTSDLLKLTLENTSIDFSEDTYSCKCMLTSLCLAHLIFCNYLIKIQLRIQFF